MTSMHVEWPASTLDALSAEEVRFLVCYVRQQLTQEDMRMYVQVRLRVQSLLSQMPDSSKFIGRLEELSKMFLFDADGAADVAMKSLGEHFLGQQMSG